MTDPALKIRPRARATDWEEIAGRLGPRFAERAASHDRAGSFVADNYRELREHGLLSMSIPSELGGGGATYAQVCATLREIGRHCGSTALSLSMHTHPVATNVYKHRHGDEAATRTLRRIAEGELAIAGTGASDWLDSSGRSERVGGGYRVHARKRFVSGVPGAQVFVTSVSHAGEAGPEVLHFAVPMSTEGLAIVETWDASGMRGTGSHDVTLTDVFVPDAAIVARRPAGVWHPMWNAILPTAMPLITSAYLGMADAAVELGTEAARRGAAEQAAAVGEMRTAWTVARLAVDDMVRANDDHRFTPSMEGTEAILARKAIATDAVKCTVELAAELVGGAGFLRGHPIERIVRDVRALHFHPLPARRQRLFTGRVALGLDPVGG